MKSKYRRANHAWSLRTFANAFVRILVTVVFLFSISRSALSEPSLSREKVLKDAKQVQMILEKYHPNLTYHRDYSALVTLWREAEAELPQNPELPDAAILIQKILASVCDAHSSLLTGGKWSTWKIGYANFLPHGLLIGNEQLYVDDKTYEKNGPRIVEINGRSSAEIIHFIRSILSTDGCSKDGALATKLSDEDHIVHVLLGKYLGDVRSFDIRFSSAAGQLSTKSVRGIGLQGFLNNEEPKNILGRVDALRSLGIDVNLGDFFDAKWQGSPAFIKLSDDKSVGYIYVNDFNWNRALEKRYDRELSDLIATSPATVIIDLSNNLGGSIRHARLFLSYFLKQASSLVKTYRTKSIEEIDSSFTWFDGSRRALQDRINAYFRKYGQFDPVKEQFTAPSPPKSFGNPSYSGRIFVIVSPRTQSAALAVAAELKRKSRAAIVGNVGDVSMKTNCLSAPGFFTLAETGLEVLVPLRCLDTERDFALRGNLSDPEVPIDLLAQRSDRYNEAAMGALLNVLGFRDD